VAGQRSSILCGKHPKRPFAFSRRHTTPEENRRGVRRRARERGEERGTELMGSCALHICSCASLPSPDHARLHCGRRCRAAGRRRWQTQRQPREQHATSIEDVPASACRVHVLHRSAASRKTSCHLAASFCSCLRHSAAAPSVFFSCRLCPCSCTCHTRKLHHPRTHGRAAAAAVIYSAAFKRHNSCDREQWPCRLTVAIGRTRDDAWLGALPSCQQRHFFLAAE
jgi:hypothetical protein